MEKYLICLDMDETILNPKKKIPFLTRLGIKLLIKNGHYVVFNSGRPYQGMLKYIKQMKMYNYPFIANNGGCIYFVNHEEDIVKSFPAFMDHNLLIYLLEEFEDQFEYIYFQGERNTIFFHESSVPDFMVHRHEKVNFKEIAHISELDENITHISLNIKTEYKKTLIEKLRKAKYNSISFELWGDFNSVSAFELNSVSTDKGIAMLNLAKALKIKKEHTMAFGDAQNDLPMLKKAAVAGIMPRGKDFIKDYPFLKEVKQSAKDNGVIYFLLKNYRHLFF